MYFSVNKVPQTNYPHEALAYWTLQPLQGALKVEPLISPPGIEAALIQTARSGISRGTESLVFNGRIPQSQYSAMRCPHQIGDFPGPVKYGYSSVGRVRLGPAEWQDRRVFCLHPHQDWYWIGTEWLLEVPEGVSDERAVLAANMETAINGIWDANIQVGDHVAVIGAGVVGVLTAALASRITGTKVVLIDIDESRKSIAKLFGCEFAMTDTAPKDMDVVIHASGNANGLTTALSIAGFESTVVELSWFGSQSVFLPLGEAFHSRRLTLRASQVGAIATSQRARWSHRRRLSLALELLMDSTFDALLSHSSHFKDLPATMSRLASNAGGELCHVVYYD